MNIEQHEGNTHTISCTEYIKMLKRTERELLDEMFRKGREQLDEQDMHMYRGMVVDVMNAINAVHNAIYRGKCDSATISEPARLITFDVPEYAHFIRVVHNDIVLFTVAE